MLSGVPWPFSTGPYITYMVTGKLSKHDTMSSKSQRELRWTSLPITPTMSPKQSDLISRIHLLKPCWDYSYVLIPNSEIISGSWVPSLKIYSSSGLFPARIPLARERTLQEAPRSRLVHTHPFSHRWQECAAHCSFLHFIKNLILRPLSRRLTTPLQHRA